MLLQSIHNACAAMITPAPLSKRYMEAWSTVIPYNSVIQGDEGVIPRRWNAQPTVVVFMSKQNRDYLKGEVLRLFNGAVGDIDLVSHMGQLGVDWYQATSDWTYPPSTQKEVMANVDIMNQRTLEGIQRDYHAQRLEVNMWRQQQHSGRQVGWVAPVSDHVFDNTTETEPWTAYNY